MLVVARLPASSRSVVVNVYYGHIGTVDLEHGTVDSDGLTDGPGGHLFGRIPLAGVQASPQRVASNIRGFFSTRFSTALPDTG